MNIEEVREYGLSLPFATERCPFGPDALALEIGGRMFCLMDLTGQWAFYNIKVDPDYGVELCDRYASIRPGFHMNKRHWVSVDFIGDVPDSLHRALIHRSYLLAAANLPRKVRRQLGFDTCAIDTGRLHTTVMGAERLRRNLGLHDLSDNELMTAIRQLVSDPAATIERRGKNYYVTSRHCLVTINASSHTVITGRRIL